MVPCLDKMKRRIELDKQMKLRQLIICFFSFIQTPRQENQDSESLTNTTVKSTKKEKIGTKRECPKDISYLQKSRKKKYDNYLLILIY